MNETRDPMTREQRQTFEELARRAVSLNCELLAEQLPKGGPFVYRLIGPGGERELSSLVSVAVALRDFQ